MEMRLQEQRKKIIILEKSKLEKMGQQEKVKIQSGKGRINEFYPFNGKKKS